MNVRDSISRRRFLGRTVVGAAGALAIPRLFAAPALVGTRTATDLVKLGQTNVKLCRLGMGTGSIGGSVQRNMGQEKFTAMIRHGLDQGLSFIDTADNYEGLHEMIKPVIKGIDREKIQIQCKIWPGRYEDPLKEIDRFRKEVGTEYFDTMLIHCVQTADWVEKFKKTRDLLDEAKEKGIVRATGVSIHGLEPLRAAAECEWGDVRFVRVNHQGASMDTLQGQKNDDDQVEKVLECVEKMHAAGKGILAMKLIGNGSFQDAALRKASIDFVMGLDCVDVAIIGFKTAAEIDEAIANINNALAQKDAGKEAA